MLIQRIEGLYKAASFGNLLIFLYTGRYALEHQAILLLDFFLEPSTKKSLLILKSITKRILHGSNKLNMEDKSQVADYS